LTSLALAALLAACGGASTDSASTSKPTVLKSGVTDSFGLIVEEKAFTVDTGAGLVFKIRRDNPTNTTSPGDIASLVYNGVQYQDPLRGSQVNSGFDWLYNDTSLATVDAETVGTDFVKVTVTAGRLTHYYIAKRGEAKIYMATYFTQEPQVHALVRYILRVPIAVLPNGPVPSDIRNNAGAIEASDVFKLANGQTRSKHYSNMRLKDWRYIGATGPGVGMWVLRDNNEGGSGGPFYRGLLNQGTDSTQEITYLVNYGEAQTEAFRMGVLNSYTLVFNDGSAPAPVDTSFFSQLNLLGFKGPQERGAVAGAGITGRAAGSPYTVSFANANAQYWADADPVTGSFSSTGMIPGTYTMRTYKNELLVDTRSVTVNANATAQVDSYAITGDPGSVTPTWRIGNWDGTPTEFLNGDKVTTMHPSDVRMASWVTPPYVVGTSNPATGFPAYQWKGVNNPITIKFHLRASQLVAHTVRVGITVAYANARPIISVNGWNSAIPAISSQPNTRTLTVGSYRGNNTTFTFNIPANVLVAGTNTMTLAPASGSGAATGFLSAGYSIDAVDMVRTN
jgi:rhamnogalacturonan endolyase